MVNVRRHVDRDSAEWPPDGATPGLGRRARLNVLLTEDYPQPTEHWTVQMQRLLEPLGVASFVARNGEEALEVTARVQIHAAVVDLSTPMAPPARRRAGMGSPGELWLLDLLRRLPTRPPVVVVRSPAFSRVDMDRLMAEALRLGAFSVLNKPVDLERMLAVFQRLIERRYRGSWPGPGDDSPAL